MNIDRHYQLKLIFFYMASTDASSSSTWIDVVASLLFNFELNNKNIDTDDFLTGRPLTKKLYPLSSTLAYSLLMLDEKEDEINDVEKWMTII